MERKTAEKVQKLTLAAIRDLVKVAAVMDDEAPNDPAREPIRKGIGIAMGRLQSGVLDVVAREYPDLDDLAK